MFHLITGGSGSGKSEYAESEVERLAHLTESEEKYYIATMFPYGEETLQKIRRHQQMRTGKGFVTLECYTDLYRLAASDPFSRAGQTEGQDERQNGHVSGNRKSRKHTVVLLECMSNLAANEMFEEKGAGEKTVEAVLEGIKKLRSQVRHLVIVTNEIFSEAASYEGDTIRYQEYLGIINQNIGKMADEVVEVVYGIPIWHKGGKIIENAVE